MESMSFFSTKDALPYTYLLSLLVIVSLPWTREKLRLKQKRALYDRWIQRARDERDSKPNRVLSESIDEKTQQLFLSAVETKDAILQNKLDLRKNVVALAQRCRKFGRDENGGVNAVAEEFYDEAPSTAESLNRGTNRRKGEAPPILYGIPISVKESLGLKGSYSTGGLACRLRKRVENDSLVVQLAKAAGAIPIVTSNVPQILMLPESVNRIWGRSLNPWDLTRTPGGSSGGDGALVAMGCVPMAIGSDIAGSIRIPASFCGVVGFKPTSTRMSLHGYTKPRKEGKDGTSIAIPAVAGPIARTVEDCALFMRATLTPQLFQGDLNVVPIPFNQEEYQRRDKLRIGYFDSDGWFEPCCTLKRAVRETVDVMTKAGHTCVPFQPPTDGWHSYGLLVAINGAEGDLRSFVEALEGEEIIAEYKTLLLASRLPHWLRWVARNLIDKRRGHLLSQMRAGGVSVWDLWQLTAAQLELRNRWSDAMRDNDLDAIIHPAMPLPAFKHGVSGDITAACSYMFLANMLMWPSGTVPITTVCPEEAHYRDPPQDQKDVASGIAADIMKGSDGLPIGVCVMSAAYRDEKCLRVMKEVERLVNFKEQPQAYKQSVS